MFPSGHYGGHDNFGIDHEEDDSEFYDDHPFNRQDRYRNNINGIGANNVAVQTHDNGDHTRVQITQNGFYIDYAVGNSKRCSRFGNRLNALLNSGRISAKRVRKIAAKSYGCLVIYTLKRVQPNHITNQAGMIGPQMGGHMGNLMDIPGARMGQNGMHMSNGMQGLPMSPMHMAGGMGIPSVSMGTGKMGIPGISMGTEGMGMPGVNMGHDGLSMPGLHMGTDGMMMSNNMGMGGHRRRRGRW